MESYPLGWYFFANGFLAHGLNGRIRGWNIIHLDVIFFGARIERKDKRMESYPLGCYSFYARIERKDKRMEYYPLG